MEFYKAEFGSAARPDVFINCQFPGTSAEACTAWVRGIAAPRPNQFTLTFNNKTEDGNPAVVHDATVGPRAFTYSRELSAQELPAFNPWNLLRSAPNNATPDDWDPAGVRQQFEKAGQEKLVYRMSLRVGETTTVAGGPFGLGIASPGSIWFAPTIRTGGPGVKLSAAVTPRDAADPTISWSTDSNLISLSTSTGPKIEVIGKNSTEEAEYVPIKATASDGYYLTAWVFVQPKFIDPPVLVSPLKLDPPAGGAVSVDYALNLGKRKDQSQITWYTCDDATGKNATQIAVSRGNEPLKSCTLLPGDVGKFLRVSLEPKIPISDPGPAVVATADAPIAAADISSASINPNFRNFVPDPSPAPAGGLWTVEGAWSIIAGDNLVNGYGIRAGTNARNSRDPGNKLFYFKSGTTGDMQVDLVITPDKTEGTVFAVPGSPDDSGGRNYHGDIFIKYDPITQTGYSLRDPAHHQNRRRVYLPVLQNHRRRRIAPDGHASCLRRLQAKHPAHPQSQRINSNSRSPQHGRRPDPLHAGHDNAQPLQRRRRLRHRRGKHLQPDQNYLPLTSPCSQRACSPLDSLARVKSTNPNSPRRRQRPTAQRHVRSFDIRRG